MVPNGVYGCLLVSDGTYWCLRVPTGISGCLLVSVNAYWGLREPTVF